MKFVFNIGKFLMGFGGYYAATGLAGNGGPIFGSMNEYEAPERIFHIVLGVISAVIGYFVMSYANKEEQIERDSEAKLVFEEQDNKRFILYLRPFVTTGSLLIKNPYHNEWDPTAINRLGENKYIDFETLIIRTKDNFYSFVALGKPQEHIGAGRIETAEDEWFEGFKKLAYNSKLIIMVPGFQPGTFKEFHWLYDNRMFYKCIFVIPPEYVFFDKLSANEYWEETKKKILTLGIKLPELFKEGGLCVFKNNKKEFKIICHSLHNLTFHQIESIFEQNKDGIQTDNKNEVYEGVLSNVVGVCSNCDTYVLPTLEGICPSCRKFFIRKA